MAHVKKGVDGWTCFWREDGKNKQQTFIGMMAFTEAHRLRKKVSDSDPYFQPISAPKKNQNKRELIDEPGLLFPERCMRNNTGYRLITWVDEFTTHGPSYSVRLMKEGFAISQSKYFRVSVFGSKENAFEQAMIFRNKQLKDREEYLKSKNENPELFEIL